MLGTESLLSLVHRLRGAIGVDAMIHIDQNNALSRATNSIVAVHPVCYTLYLPLNSSLPEYEFAKLVYPLLV